MDNDEENSYGDHYGDEDEDIGVGRDEDEDDDE
jgi:hypothetical protein